jgi:hypothetical protein
MSGIRLGGRSLALYAVVSATAQGPGAFEPPADFLVLVQSETDHLPAARRTITLTLRDAEPAAALREVGEAAGLVLEVRGALPDRPLLSAAYRDVETKAVLEWFAESVPVYYRAEPPNKLWVIVEQEPRPATAR